MSDFKKNAWPTPEEERAKTWRHMSLIVQIVFFVLTIIALSALYGFITLLSLPAGWIVAPASIVVAELLIRRSRFWRTGVESALWIGGLFAFIFSLPSSGKVEAILVFAAAAALAGWRVRNALFGSAAVTLVVAYVAAKGWHWLALLLAIGVALIALAGLAREWQRPSTEMLWQFLILVMPIAGYVAVALRLESWTTDMRIAAIFVGLAALFTIVGVHMRLRVPLMTAVLCLAIAIVEAHDLNPVSVESALIVIGAVTLASAAAIMRSLRGKETGFVLGVAKKSELQDVMSVAPTLMPGHAAEGSGAPQPVGGGGEFGGAGASGNF